MRTFSCCLVLGWLVACGESSTDDDSTSSSSSSTTSSSSGTSVLVDGGDPSDASDAPYVDDPRTRSAEPGFVTEVVSFEPGACAGFNADAMPGVVYGAPRGAGSNMGSTDVVALGTGGSIVLGFAPLSIVDGEGVDFLVFENVFFAAGNPNRPFRELAEVSVSEDGETWHTFPCTPDVGAAQCAGATPVYSAPTNGIAPNDPSVAGGDGFDLHALGVRRARYVRIRDLSDQACNDGAPNTNGFDLDAIAIVHGDP